MELTSQKNDGSKFDNLRAAFILTCLIRIERSAVCALLAAPLVRFPDVSDAQKRYGHYLVRPGACARLRPITVPIAKTITLERRVHGRPLPSQAGGIRVAIQGWAIPHIIAYLSASGVARSAGWTIKTNSSAVPFRIVTADGERIAGPPPRSMARLNPKSRMAC